MAYLPSSRIRHLLRFIESLRLVFSAYMMHSVSYQVASLLQLVSQSVTTELTSTAHPAQSLLSAAHDVVVLRSTRCSIVMPINSSVSLPLIARRPHQCLPLYCQLGPLLCFLSSRATLMPLIRPSRQVLSISFNPSNMCPASAWDPPSFTHPLPVSAGYHMIVWRSSQTWV